MAEDNDVPDVDAREFDCGRNLSFFIPGADFAVFTGINQMTNADPWRNGDFNRYPSQPDGCPYNVRWYLLKSKHYQLWALNAINTHINMFHSHAAHNRARRDSNDLSLRAHNKYNAFTPFCF